MYVDFRTGNWCEGLTAYMADHLLAEQRGEGATYRRATLKKYSDFVTSADDFPLAEFRSRHSAATEAVGYGKSLMLFHMVRRAVGDEAFLGSLRRFYDDHRYRRASFSDLAAAFEAEAGGDWGSFFATWVGRPAAPRIEIVDVEVLEAPVAAHPYLIRLELRQGQPGDPFPTTVPIAVTLEGRSEPLWFEAGTCLVDCALEIPCPARPLRLDVDPAFDVMRRLDPREVAPALSTVFGASSPLYVLPSAASVEELAAWRKLAAAWAKPGEPRIILDSELDGLPGRSAWLLGWANRLAGEVVQRLASHPVEITASEILLEGRRLQRPGHSVVLVARGVADPADAVGWVAAEPISAISGLERKLPHYTRYSYLAFEGDEPDNVAKGMWQPVASPLVRNLSSGGLVPLELPDRVPLAELPAGFDVTALGDTIATLADPGLEGRGLGSQGLDGATRWVEQRLLEIGLDPAGEDGFRRSWTWTGGEPERDMTLTNLVARIPGADPTLAGRPVVVMAHLDHLGRGWPDVRSGNRGLVHPGADDNASGVAVLLELARAMADEPARPRPVVFAVVTGEEAGRLGSRRLMDRLSEHGEPSACVNLDTVGRLSDGALYVLNADSAREWRFLFMGVGATTGAPVKVVSEPLDSSDQMSCIERGVPAVQLFTGPTADYHRPSDTADTIDADGLIVVAEAAHEAVSYLAERVEPLTVTIADAGDAKASREGQRRASLGTMPDFAFPGPGVRVQQVVPGSAAEAAGLLAGDVVTMVAGREVTDLRSYSALLRKLAPGDQVVITVVRDGAEVTVTATLGQR